MNQKCAVGVVRVWGARRCMRTLTGAEEFAAIRTYTATAMRQGQNMLDVLIDAAGGNPWIPAS